MSARPYAAPSLLRSILAGFACALVLGLGLLAHAPAAHAWLHASTCEAAHPHAHEDSAAGASSDHAPASPSDSDHFCGVTAFAHGTDAPAPALLVAAPLSTPVVAPLSEAQPRLSRAAHLLPLGRAPPRA